MKGELEPLVGFEQPPAVAYLGVDPGTGGGLAVVYGGGDKAFASPVPPTLTDLWEWLYTVAKAFSAERRPHFACIERVHAMPKQGVSSTFKFGVSYGSLLMALTAARIPFEEVTPAVWQRAMGVTPRHRKGDAKTAESKTAYKNRLKGRCQQLFPQTKVTLATCDALLIAEFCRRRREGRL